MEQLTLFAEDHLASRSVSPESAMDFQGLLDSCGSMFELFRKSCLTGSSGRTSLGRFRARAGRISDACSEPWMTSGMVSHGEFWTRSSSESPNAAAVCSLSEVLERGGAERAVSVLFEPEGLRWDFKTGREERARLAADAERGSGTPEGGVLAFAQNQRDEVRTMEVPGAIAANQGTHQTSNVLTPWDVQSKRVLTEDGPAPTLCTHDGRGVKDNQPCIAVKTDHPGQNGMIHSVEVSPTLDTQSKPAVAYGFKFHQGAAAGNIGYEEEQSPTLTADYHNPAVITNYGEDLAGTLTSRADSSAGPMQGQNVVCMMDGQSNAAIDYDMGGVLTAHAGKEAPIVAHRTGMTCSPTSTPPMAPSSS